MDNEKRHNPRFECYGTAGIQLNPGELAHPARIVNLSSGGCLLVLEEPHALTQDTTVELTFKVNDLPFRVWGKVRAIRSDTQVGFQFPLMSERVRQRLESLIEELIEDSLTRRARGLARDNRRHPRIQCIGTAGLQIAAGEPVVPAKIVNLSAGGCMMVLQKPQRLEEDMQVELSFQINHLPFRVQGQPKGVRADNRVGFQFVQVSERVRRQLEDMIEELIGNIVKRFATRQK